MRLLLRARAPFTTDVEARVTVGGVDAGALRVPAGDFTERSMTLSPEAAAALEGPGVVTISFRSPVVSPVEAGRGSDPRKLGFGVDWIALRMRG